MMRMNLFTIFDRHQVNVGVAVLKLRDRMNDNDRLLQKLDEKDANKESKEYKELLNSRFRYEHDVIGAIQTLTFALENGENFKT